MLNIAYNVLCGGRSLEIIEVRRNDEAFLDALGVEPGFDSSRSHGSATALNKRRQLREFDLPEVVLDVPSGVAAAPTPSLRRGPRAGARRGGARGRSFSPDFSVRQAASTRSGCL